MKVRLKRHFTLELCNLGIFFSRNFKLTDLSCSSDKLTDEKKKRRKILNVNDVKS